MPDTKTYKLSRGTWLYITLSLLGAIWAVYFYNAVPDYTDSYYHLNGAISLASGEGFTDDYLWTFIGAPDSLPAPSHLYWMPGTSIVLSLGMFIFGTGYAAGQIGLVLCLWGALLVAYWLGWHLGKSARYAWSAGLLTLFAGYFLDVWGQSDTFAPYAVFGAVALVLMAIGISQEKHNWRYWLVAGLFAGLGHLVRSDGLILLLVGWCVLLYPLNFDRFGKRLLWLVPFTLAYVLMMSPWFARNLTEIGSILPTGGTQNAWFTEYNELFNYPPDATPETLFADGTDAFWEARRFATLTASGIPVQALAYQGVIIFFPFILIALWHRRREAFMRPFWIFAVGIHLAFALVFSYAGVRGGFWHAIAALVPIWAVVGLLGLDDAIVYIASKRKRWRADTAKVVFSVGLVIMTVVFSISLSERALVDDDAVALALQDAIPEDARVMLNDPARYYYYIGVEGVTIPNETPAVALEIAEIYDIDYLLLVENEITTPMQFDTPPDFLIPQPFDIPGASLYAFDRD
ncbi:MAG: hypothetical protein AAFR81_00795 [Chloroflexota bacterium]